MTSSLGTRMGDSDQVKLLGAILLAPTKSPACLSHDQTGFQPVAYR